MNIIALSPVYGRPDEYYQDKLRYLHPYLLSSVNIQYRSLPCGFPSIESEYHAASNSAALLEQVEKASKEKNVDGIFIDCFDDPAVTAAREISPLPVCGPYDASIKTASLISSDIGIITTDDYGISCERRKALAHGYSHFIRDIKPIGSRVLNLSSIDMAERIFELAQEFEKKAIYTVILGCTGMYLQAEEAQQKLTAAGSPVQIIEPLRTGILSLIMLISGNYTTAMPYATI